MRPHPLLRASFFLISTIGLMSQPALAQAQDPSPSQSSPPSPVRDAQALATVQSAITAMGGTTAIGAIQSSVAQGGLEQPQQRQRHGNYQ